MAIFDLFSKRPRQFVSEKSFQENLIRQLKMSPMTLEQLRKIDVSPERELKLEYFFYTNSIEKSLSLVAVLKSLGYDVEHRPSASNKKLQIVTGWTQKMPMTIETVTERTRQMCEEGYNHDCEFDGWGTTPEQ